MKYKLFRSLGEIDVNYEQHELVAVEYGASIDDVVPALVKDIEDDLLSTPEYAKCRVAGFSPQPSDDVFGRYEYTMLGVVYPPYASENILIEFGVTEEEGSEYEA